MRNLIEQWTFLMIDDIRLYKTFSNMFLYKYRQINKWTLKSLSEKTIHFNCPTDFNDPYDCFVNVYGRGSEDDWKNFQQQNNYSDTEIEKFKRVFRTEESTNILNRKNLVQDIRVFCLSEEYDNIEMWSYYADNHRGICLIYKPVYEKFLLLHKEDFDNQNPKIDSSLAMLFKIEYSESMAKPMNHLKFDNSELSKFFTTKKISWKHENEWRIVTTNKQLKINDPRCIDGHLQGIIFGSNCSESDLKLVKDAVAGQQLHFYTAEISPKEYKLNIIPLLKEN